MTIYAVGLNQTDYVPAAYFFCTNTDMTRTPEGMPSAENANLHGLLT